jgi:alkylated DNA repair dioxygenase AlkB
MFCQEVQVLSSLEDSLFVSYNKNFINEEDANKIFDLFERKMEYNSDAESQITIMGKKMNIPRKQTAYGDPSISYHFSGATVNARDWNKDDLICRYIKSIRDKVAKRFSCNFNYVLINRYDSGDQCIGFHSDDEKDLQGDSPIVGISFGSSRELTLKHKEKNITKKLVLSNGSAYCMHYPTNKKWKHAILRTKLVVGPRVSLTFRKMN